MDNTPIIFGTTWRSVYSIMRHIQELKTKRFKDGLANAIHR